MKNVLKYDRVILIKELDNKVCKLGECYEIANVLDDSFVLREAESKTAVGVIDFASFEKHFVHEENYKGWTNWQKFSGFDGQSDCFYRTNGKKVQVKFLTNNVRAEACCCNGDEFNLSFGLNLAYLRARTKIIKKRIALYEEELNNLNKKMANDNKTMQKMLNSITD